jgi:circadian clock protein KaiC
MPAMKKRVSRKPIASANGLHKIAKCPTGVRGLDDILGGGLPRGRPTLICGAAGCGKTLLAMEFIVRGILEFGETGVFMAFEETEVELSQNVASLGFDLPALIRRKQLGVDYVHVERSEIEETGEYNLEGLFVRLNMMIEQTGAKRVALDSLEALFAGLPNEAILRAELRRLFRWLKDKGVTAVITAEQGLNQLTRHGLEEYVSDCVLFLDHRIRNQVGTRRLRVVKYRGSPHGTNEYPTMIDEHGLSVLPISSLGMDYPVMNARISSGIPRLDTMLGGQGYHRGSSILVSGTAGSGKSSIAAAFVDAACRLGERCLYLAYEESPRQIMRNMDSIGYDLALWQRKGFLRFHAVRSTLYGLEQHLVTIHKHLDEFKPSVMVIDPITTMTTIGEPSEIQAMLSRVVDLLKSRGITALFTSLTSGHTSHLEQTDTAISSLVDAWLLLRNVESGSERNRLLFILKCRGTAHSNQVREFVLTSKGVQLTDVYVGQGKVLTGSARLLQELQDKTKTALAREETASRRRELKQAQRRIQAQVDDLLSQSALLEEAFKSSLHSEETRAEISITDTAKIAHSRGAD